MGEFAAFLGIVDRVDKYMELVTHRVKDDNTTLLEQMWCVQRKLLVL
ncbi:hypothetical protein HMPREF1861_01623 [Corynebacterium kroppenstedtii]|nr:hypothetical protein HMPREF1861_01623 [Corynebacterium kroppenstedtii]